MAEYIERNIFINNELIPLVKTLDFCHPKQKKGVLMAISKLRETPAADVVEVVRCKDCRYFDTDDCEKCGDKNEPCGCCHYYGSCVSEDGYCYRGDRMKGSK